MAPKRIWSSITLIQRPRFPESPRFGPPQRRSSIWNFPNANYFAGPAIWRSASRKVQSRDIISGVATGPRSANARVGMQTVTQAGCNPVVFGLWGFKSLSAHNIFTLGLRRLRGEILKHCRQSSGCSARPVPGPLSSTGEHFLGTEEIRVRFSERAPLSECI